jgi:GNAT superfamily N-acetyltransferase
MNRTSKTSEFIRRPAACDASQLAAFQYSMIQGGQAKIAGLSERIDRTRWLGFQYEDGELAAVAAPKRPADRYRQQVFRKAKAPLSPDSFDAERGWVVTSESFRRRGIGRRLSARLIDRATGVDLFATTRTDNLPMEEILQSLGFQPVGEPFPGAGDSYFLRLWIRVTEAPATLVGQ